MASLLSNSRRRRIDKSCHFCGASTSKDCRCGGWSRKDQFGKLLDYLPEMSDVSLNPIPISPDRSFHNQISPKPSPSDSDRKPIRSSEEKPDQSDSPFCRTCRTNQMLQLNLLANYLPDDDTDQTMTEPLNSSSSSRDLMRDLPRYKKRLESRYPVVCPGCSKRVTKIIKDKDYRLKAQSFSDSIKKFTSVTNIKSINLKGRSVSKGSSSLNFNIRKLRWFAITRALWSFGGSLWRFSHLLGIVTAIYCTISNPKNLIETRSLSKSCLSHSWNQFNFFGDTCKLLYCFHLVDFICSMSYDPTWLRAHKLKVQGIKVDLKGRKRLLLLNILSFILRSMVLEYLVGSLNPWTKALKIDHLQLSTFFGILSLVLLVLFIGSLWIIEIKSKIGLTKAGFNNVTTTNQNYNTDGLNYKLSDQKQHDYLSQLTLSDKHSYEDDDFSNVNPIDHIHKETGEGQKEEMDWEPIVEPTPTGFLDLPPQKFLPPAKLREKEEIGIEDLFAKKVKLKEDVPNLGSMNSLKEFYHAWTKKLTAHK